VLKKQIASAKKEALTSNKKELTRLITNELVTRYYYKEGLYNFHVFNDESIQKSIQILSSDKYNLILK
jgi:carboxyl-terminal processing protease